MSYTHCNLVYKGIFIYYCFIIATMSYFWQAHTSQDHFCSVTDEFPGGNSESGEAMSGKRSTAYNLKLIELSL